MAEKVWGDRDRRTMNLRRSIGPRGTYVHSNHHTIRTKEDDPNDERQRDSEPFVPRMSKKLTMMVHNANYADFEDKQSRDCNENGKENE